MKVNQNRRVVENETDMAQVNVEISVGKLNIHLYLYHNKFSRLIYLLRCGKNCFWYTVWNPINI